MSLYHIASGELKKENNKLKEENKHLKSQLQQKENIIKEVREYIEDNSDDMHTYISQVLTDILKGSDK